MATLPSSSIKTLTLDSSSVFLSSSKLYPILPPIPSDLPQTLIIPNTRFIVDGFKSAGDFSVSYFLSHFHSDRYAGLNPNWSKGIVFCSETTAKLLVQTLKVSPLFIVSLELNVAVEIDGCEVTAIDANCSPGAVQFLFKVRTPDLNLKRYIHTGDFRYRDSVKNDLILHQFIGADSVFLDTTYCNPKFAFPSEEESINYIVSTIERIRVEGSVLFLIAAYVIGKERMLLEISRRCNCLLHVDHGKMEVLSILGFGDTSVFTVDVAASNVHVVAWDLLGDSWPYFQPNFVKMKEIMKGRGGYLKVVGFVATDWTYDTKREVFVMARIKEGMEIHLVPYSEHSSYEELREYMGFLRPKCVFPTVGKHVGTHLMGLVDESGNDNETGNVDMDGDDLMNSKNQPEDVEEAEKELRVCLPSWVTKDQVLCLLRGSKGDIIEAATEFFEHETKFYEKANACLEPPNLQTGGISFPDVKSSQGCVTKLVDMGKESVGTSLVTLKSSVPKKKGSSVGNTTKKKGKKFSALKSPQVRGSKLSDIVKKSVNASPATPKSSVPKKGGSSVVNKTNKKGKVSSTLESDGSKQSTITKFFGKVVPSKSQDNWCNVRDEEMEMDVDAVEMYRQELDQFLQIIDNGIAMKTAASLLRKAEGNVGIAVDMYYSICTRVFGDEESYMHCDAKADSAETTSNTSLPSIVHGNSLDGRNILNASLPIEKYSAGMQSCVSFFWNVLQSMLLDSASVGHGFVSDTVRLVFHKIVLVFLKGYTHTHVRPVCSNTGMLEKMKNPSNIDYNIIYFAACRKFGEPASVVPGMNL